MKDALLMKKTYLFFFGLFLATILAALNINLNKDMGALTCKEVVVVSISDSCRYTISAKDVLENSSYNPNTPYSVSISKNALGPWRVPAVVNYRDCGTWYYRIVEVPTGIVCQGSLTVEDKTAPEITCGVCEERLAGMLETSDESGQILGFSDNPVPVSGITCGLNQIGNTDYVRFTLPVTGSGKYKFTLDSPLAVDSVNTDNQLVLALFGGAPNPGNSCTHLLLTDGQSLNGATETLHGHFDNVVLTPGNTYWIAVQKAKQASGASVTFPHPWAVRIIDAVTGTNALTGPDFCKISCVDKPALLEYLSKGQVSQVISLGIPAPVVSGSFCGDAPLFDVRLKEDNSTSCGGYIIMEWSVTEACGNKAIMDCKVSISPVALNDVIFPTGVTDTLKIACLGGNTPEEISVQWDTTAAFPYFRGKNGKTVPANKACHFSVTYDDITEGKCGSQCNGSATISRKWKVLDRCGDMLAEATQFIVIKDLEAPVFEVRDTIFATSPWECKADFYLPRPEQLRDKCDANPRYEVISLAGIPLIWDAGKGQYRANGVSTGKTAFVYRVFDCCGNTARDTIQVTVADRTVPVAVIKQNIVISLVPGGSDGAGQAKMFVGSVDNGSFDNCSTVRTEIRRLDNATCKTINAGNNGHNNNSTFGNTPLPGYSNSVDDTDGGQFVKFCCDDIDPTKGFGVVRVELRVWDDGNGNGIAGDVVAGIADNYSVSWVDVRVENKIPPVITCPPNMTVFCSTDFYTTPNESPIPITGVDFSKTGLPSAYGVCGPASIRFWDRKILDPCGLGYIDRTFLVTNNNQTVKCVQRITVQRDTLPTWTFISSSLSETPIPIGCNGPTPSEINNYGPAFTAGKCDVIGVSTKIDPVVTSQDECRRWKVEYKYMNWCTQEGKGPFYKYFVQKDTLAPVMTCENKVFPVDSSCEAQVRLSKKAVDGGTCAAGGGLKWEVFIDLKADGKQDLLYSSYYSGPQGAEDTIAINGTPNIIKLYTLPSTNSNEEVAITLPDKISGRMSQHQVVWKVQDGCLNEKTCTEQFTVLDTTPPTQACVSLSMPMGDMVGLTAKDFTKGTEDNCTPSADLLFTFDGWKPQVTIQPDSAGNPMSIEHAHFFNATGGIASAVDTTTSVYSAALAQYQAGNLQLWVPSNQSSSKILVPNTTDVSMCLDIQVTVWDQNLNADFCSTTLKLSVAGEPSPAISGTIKMADGRPVDKVTIAVEANEPESPFTAQSNANGLYERLVQGCNAYTIQAEKTGGYLNGVTSLDMVIIQRHVLGIRLLDGPYKRIAADVTNDGMITISDMIEVQSLILGRIKEFTRNKSWRFPIADQTLDPENPFPFREKIQVYIQKEQLTNQNFVAVKIGDVSGNARPGFNSESTENRMAGDFVLAVTDQLIEKDELIEIPVKASQSMLISGMQFNLMLRGAQLEGISSGSIEIGEANVYIPESDGIALIYTPQHDVLIQKGDVLFTLKIRAHRSTKISDILSLKTDWMEAEFYDSELESGKIRLVFNALGEKALNLLQNEPNPFKDQTTVIFRLPIAAKVTLRIFDSLGKEVAMRNIEGAAGENREVFTHEQLGANGVLYCTLESGGSTTMRKMIMLR